ncbi:hypothetical protein LP419_39715 [Massilia sp. H-1]|nr:hypothetical protein LP419_39715 [Massilia sp. H-1]
MQGNRVELIASGVNADIGGAGTLRINSNILGSGGFAAKAERRHPDSRNGGRPETDPRPVLRLGGVGPGRRRRQPVDRGLARSWTPRSN